MRICPQCHEQTDARSCPNDGSATLDAQAFGELTSLKGKVFDGRYAVQDPIGQGGMGTVYRAKQLSVGRAVALKVLDESLARDVEMAGRFVREAQLASRLQHPNTIVIHDFGHTREGLFIAMELLEGQTLRSRLAERGPFPLEEALEVARQIASSLGHAHRHHVVHRDLKPENVFLHRLGDSDVVKVLDFGIAKVFEDLGPSSEEVFQTSQGAGKEPRVFGTYHYMAPEQIEGDAVDARADVYALGIILYEMIAGHRPFPGETMLAVLRMHVQEPPLPLPDAVPDEVAYLVYALLSKKPEQRPADGHAVVKELERVTAIVRGTPLVAKDAPARRRQSRGSMARVRARTDSRAGSGAAVKAWSDQAARRSRLAWVRHGDKVRAFLVLLAIVAVLALGAWALRYKPAAPAAVASPTGDVPGEVEADLPLEPDEGTDEPPPVVVEPPAPVDPPIPLETDRRAWLKVERGQFTMGRERGAPAFEPGEGPPHPVRIGHDLIVRSTEVTQQEWEALMGNNPSGHRDCPRCPVENVNWYEALAFCNALSTHHGRSTCYTLRDCSGKAGEGMRCADAQLSGLECTGYRLPTEAEWEYLARSGGRPDALEDAAWFGANAGGQTHEVGQRQPNRYGARDLLGNVAEWVHDVHSVRYYEWGPEEDPTGPAMGDTRVLRGCDFNADAERCDFGARRGREPIVLDNALGFRPVRTSR